MWLDGKQARQVGMAFDENSSLISIKASDKTIDALLSAARRIRRQVRSHDSVWLGNTTCALLLPTTPLSGAQAVAKRIAPLLSGFSCEIHISHGATARLTLQHLHAAGSRFVAPEECDDLLSPASLDTEQATCQEMASMPLPYLAFLTEYPSPRLLHLFPYELACRYQCVPVGSERKMLTLATRHWLNHEIITQVSGATRRDIFQVRCEGTIIEEVLRYWQRVQELSNLERAASQMNEMYSSAR